MKKILVLLAVAISAISGIPAFTQTTEFYKQKVVDTDLLKDAMWNNLNIWVSITFNKSKNVIDYEDKDAGKMILKFNHNFGGKSFLVNSGSVKLEARYLVTVDVKDNKFRYTSPNGSVAISLGNIYSNMKDMSSSELRKSADDLEWMVEISRKYFNESLEWTIDENFDEIIQEFNDELSALPQTNKKGKPNPEWEALNRRIEFLHDVKNGYYSIINNVLASLVEGITSSDDF